jgi:predicted Zn-dependent protease
MSKPYGLVVVLVVLVAAGATVWMGEMQADVSLASTSEIWGDLLRDADQFGLNLTRMSDAKEMELGNRLASAMITSGATDPAWETYVSAVGATLAPNLRRQGIQYRFHVLQSPVVNAFALPGGHVFVFTGMLEFIHSEAELAAVLGHEMSHVDLRHCVELYQYQAAFEKVGVGGVGQMVEQVRRLTARGYSKYQELEADAQGFRLIALAGYNPEASVVFFTRLRQVFGEPPPSSARTPVGELAGAVVHEVGSYFQSHPPTAERLRRLDALVAHNRKRLAGRPFYEGVENYLRRIPRSQQQFPHELRTV